MIWIGYAVVGGAILFTIVVQWGMKKYFKRQSKKWCKERGITYRSWEWE